MAFSPLGIGSGINCSTATAGGKQGGLDRAGLKGRRFSSPLPCRRPGGGDREGCHRQCVLARFHEPFVQYGQRLAAEGVVESQVERGLAWCGVCRYLQAAGVSHAKAADPLEGGDGSQGWCAVVLATPGVAFSHQLGGDAAVVQERLEGKQVECDCHFCPWGQRFRRPFPPDQRDLPAKGDVPLGRVGGGEANRPPG